MLPAGVLLSLHLRGTGAAVFLPVVRIGKGPLAFCTPAHPIRQRIAIFVWPVPHILLRPDGIPDHVVQIPVRGQNTVHEIVAIDGTIMDRGIIGVDDMAALFCFQADASLIVRAFIPGQLPDALPQILGR